VNSRTQNAHQTQGLKVRTKILLGFGAGLIIFILGISIALVRIDANVDATHSLETRYQQQLVMAKVQHLNTELTLLFMDIIIDKDEAKVSEERKQYLQHIQTELAQARTQALEAADTASEQAEVQDIFTNIDRIYALGAQKLIPAVETGKADAALVAELDDLIDELEDKNLDLADAVVLSVQNEVTEAKAENEAANERGHVFIFATLGLGIVVSLILSWVLSNSITRPLGGEPGEMAHLAESVAAGELRQDLSRMEQSQGLYHAMLSMVKSLVLVFTGVRAHAQRLASSSSELSAISSQMAGNADKVNAMSNQVASATEQINTNIQGMATGAEQISGNINAIAATATEVSQSMADITDSVKQLANNITEVARQSREASSVSEEAVIRSTHAFEVMHRLDESATEIGDVTAIIKTLAQQTNLLALNANIEAASAGDAGKGFAVVANEIKELASQSGKAAEEIAKKVNGIQGNTSDAVQGIEQIGGGIRTMGEAAKSILKATEAQTLAANSCSANLSESNRGTVELARLIEEISSAASDFAHRATELSAATEQISQNINTVSAAAKDNSAGAQQVNTEAADLAKISEALAQDLQKFNI